jgi:UDP-3-O-[3-hydroxymyristoyl] glucosamine N-acyltransferase
LTLRLRQESTRMGLTLGELAESIGGELQGDPDAVVNTVATLQNAGPDAVSFLANSRYRKYLQHTAAAAVILSPEFATECPTATIVTDNPYAAYARAAARVVPPVPPHRGVHPSASVGKDCAIDSSVWIGPNCIIEEHVHIGAGTQLAGGCFIGRDTRIGAGGYLHANVVICHAVRIGERVIIHPGAVVGSDGFGLANEGGRWLKVPQLGSVRIGDDVEIGANTSIDRGALDDTVLEDGVKLDNQIQVAHNVHIGAHTAIAGCVGISGSARIGRHCMIGGGAGIVGHLEIADNVTVTGMTMVTRSITSPGVYSSGVPAQENSDWNRNYARLRKLDQIVRRLQALERRFDGKD